MYCMRRANLTLERESAGVCCCVVIRTLFGEVIHVTDKILPVTSVGI